MAKDTYGRSFSGIRYDSEGHMQTVTTLKYGAEGEAGLANLRKGAESAASALRLPPSGRAPITTHCGRRRLAGQKIELAPWAAARDDERTSEAR